MTTRPSGRLDAAAPTDGTVQEAYTAHESSLKRFIGRFMRGPVDIEDIAQKGFLRAYTVERSRPIEQPKSFLFPGRTASLVSQGRRRGGQ